jgi:hypothetical protein
MREVLLQESESDRNGMIIAASTSLLEKLKHDLLQVDAVMDSLKHKMEWLEGILSGEIEVK